MKGSRNRPGEVNSRGALGLAAKLQDENDRLRAALKTFADEPLSTEPEHNRTRLFSFTDHDEKIRRAREALSR